MNGSTTWATLAQQLTPHRHALSGPQLLLLGAWLLTMIAIPILLWLIGEPALWWGVNLSVLFLVIAVLAIVHKAWGTHRTTAVVLPLLGVAWLLEWVGHTTGYPFGTYQYTAALQPQIGGVPLLIPLAWLMMLPSAWAVGASLSGGQRGWRFVLISAAAFTAWDFFLDPQMVAWGYWQWLEGGGYFGIPWLNFAGWFLGAALITTLVRPPAVPVVPLLMIYILTWLLQSIGQALFWAMPGPALVGFFAMGSFVFLITVLRPSPTYPIR